MLIFAAQEADSYMAGQRAALMEAFQLMLPGQQQLGSMASNLQRIQSQVLASASLSWGPSAGQGLNCKPCSWIVLVPSIKHTGVIAHQGQKINSTCAVL